MEFSVTGNLVDLHNRTIYPAEVTVVDGFISRIERIQSAESFLMPGFVDSHIHIESSMLLPSEFARIAVTHGTVATVSDPHEIANVCGISGVDLMMRNAAQTNFKFTFGVPSCVPATQFETAGAILDAAAVTELLDNDQIGYLSEVMDFPGVLQRAPEVMAKINAAIARGKPIDGHAPGLRGDDAANYVAAGITTDHECVCIDEALDKIRVGCKIAIREGSAARNFDALQKLIDQHPDSCMLCSDDKHPDELLLGHINQVAARAIAAGRDLMNVLQVACINPIKHYRLDVGMLRVGDPADFIVVHDLVKFDVAKTYIDGELVAQDGRCMTDAVKPQSINQFVADPIDEEMLQVKALSSKMRVIEAIDGQLMTNSLQCDCSIKNDLAVTNVAEDLLKIVVVNRYENAAPAVAFIKGFGLQSGAIASSVAHDSHNVVAVGTSDSELVTAINAVIANQGGLSVVGKGHTDVLALPVAGLMSTESCEIVAAAYSKLDQQAKELGTNLRSPFMTLSFMALLVIPSLKLSDKGLFDVNKFGFVPLFVDEALT
ncbi:Adenine deaminase [Rubripirellula obstinata]|uniref:Adenine deaminase n=1 Tax=Rubripirellula obstinata TaxID=406547 RepID=A0A5B1CI42_9BACT|nr:adenine deaminase [Rubripirellula obstinata]KAA1259615.1 Adenine deaminase [Rubripirellula obstinata]